MASTPPKLATRLLKSAANIWVRFNKCSSEFAEIKLGQGQPDYAPSEYIQKTLSQVALEGNDYLQYTREQGHPRLVKAIANLHGPLLKRDLDPMNEVIVTHGAYESLCISFLSLINPGDEVIFIEPFYDSYEPMTRMAEGVPVYVPLRPTVDPLAKSSHWRLDPVELESKFTNKTKMIVLNTPNNPLGKVYSKQELEVIAKLCVKYDVLCLSDEVYEWLVYPGSEHVRIATLPGMWERTITISSASKSFSVTGWRIGWSIGPKELIDCLMIAHQNGDCVCATPSQEAIARCIETELPRLTDPNGHFAVQLNTLHRKRELLLELLTGAGFKPCVPDAGYFVVADWTGLATNEKIEDGSGDPADFKFAMWLMKEHKIASIPTSAFYGDNKDIASRYVRFCFFKTDELFSKAKSYFDSIGAV